MRVIVILAVLACLLFASACSQKTIWSASQENIGAGSVPGNDDAAITIFNEGISVEITRAVAIERTNDILLSLTVKRKNYRSLPRGAHINTYVYDHKGELIETQTMPIRNHEFRRRANDTYAPAIIDEHIDTQRSEIGKIEVIAFHTRHDEHPHNDFRCTHSASE